MLQIQVCLKRLTEAAVSDVNAVILKERFFFSQFPKIKKQSQLAAAQTDVSLGERKE